MNAMVGPTVALAKAGASADSAEKMKHTMVVNPWRLHSESLANGFLVSREVAVNEGEVKAGKDRRVALVFQQKFK